VTGETVSARRVWCPWRTAADCASNEVQPTRVLYSVPPTRVLNPAGVTFIMSTERSLSHNDMNAPRLQQTWYSGVHAQARDKIRSLISLIKHGTIVLVVERGNVDTAVPQAARRGVL
jgi:hypothetical protein